MPDVEWNLNLVNFPAYEKSSEYFEYEAVSRRVARSAYEYVKLVAVGSDSAKSVEVSGTSSLLLSGSTSVDFDLTDASKTPSLIIKHDQGSILPFYVCLGFPKKFFTGAHIVVLASDYTRSTEDKSVLSYVSTELHFHDGASPCFEYYPNEAKLLNYTDQGSAPDTERVT